MKEKIEYKHQKPKKLTEECTEIVAYNYFVEKKKWFCNYLSVPGGSWNEIHIRSKNQTFTLFWGKLQKRLDMIFQKEKKDEIVFCLFEGKENIKKVENELDKIKKCFEKTIDFIKNSKNPETRKEIFDKKHKLKFIKALVFGCKKEELKGVEERIKNLIKEIGGICLIFLVYWDYEGYKTKIFSSQKYFL